MTGKIDLRPSVREQLSMMRPAAQCTTVEQIEQSMLEFIEFIWEKQRRPTGPGELSLRYGRRLLSLGSEFNKVMDSLIEREIVVRSKTNRSSIVYSCSRMWDEVNEFEGLEDWQGPAFALQNVYKEYHRAMTERRKGGAESYPVGLL